MRILGSSVFLATVLIAGPALATHPLGTEDPGTAGPGTLQVEVTGESSHLPDGSETDLGIQFTTGVVPHLDIALRAGEIVVSPDEGSSNSGLGDLEVALKWNVLEAAEGVPGLALKVGTTLPTGNEDKGLGSGGHELSGALIAARFLGNVGLFLNLGYTRIDRTAEGDNSVIVTASMAADWDMTETLALVGEVLFESPGADGEDPPVAATAGLVWEIADNFLLDLGARVGLTDSAPDWGVLAGINCTFGGVGPGEEKRER